MTTPDITNATAAGTATRKKANSGLREILWTVLFAIIAFMLLRVSIQTFRVEMPSMEPTIQPGWWVVVDKVSYRFGEPKRGDIIIFNAPIDMERDFIKRMIAVPGDTVGVMNTRVYVNGTALEEPYIETPGHYTMASRVIPADQYFVLGDNRDVSVDSHYGWLVPRDSIVGRAWLVVWPPGNWGRAPNEGLNVDSNGSVPVASVR